MSESQYRVQYYDQYEVGFTSTVPTLGDDFNRNIIKYLYHKDNTGEDVLITEGTQFSGVFGSEIGNNTNYDGYAIMSAIIGNNNNQSLAVGLVVELHANSPNGTPYFFLANNEKLSFWKTDIENYNGTFSITPTNFVVQDVLGIRKANASSPCEVTIPYKSAFLVGKYENCIANQDRIVYSQNNTAATGYNAAIYKWKTTSEAVQPISIVKGRRKFNKN